MYSTLKAKILTKYIGQVKTEKDYEEMQSSDTTVEKGCSISHWTLGRHAILHNLIFTLWQLNVNGKSFKLKDSP